MALPGLPGMPGGQPLNFNAENKSSSAYGPVTISSPFNFNAGLPKWVLPAILVGAAVLWWSKR